MGDDIVQAMQVLATVPKTGRVNVQRVIGVALVAVATVVDRQGPMSTDYLVIKALAAELEARARETRD